MRLWLMRDHSMSTVGRTCPANSMSNRATVASSSGRAWSSKASWPFTVRATQAANSACLSAWGSVLVFRQADGHSRDGSRRLVLGETREEV